MQEKVPRKFTYRITQKGVGDRDSLTYRKYESEISVGKLVPMATEALTKSPVSRRNADL